MRSRVVAFGVLVVFCIVAVGAAVVIVVVGVGNDCKVSECAVVVVWLKVEQILVGGKLFVVFREVDKAKVVIYGCLSIVQLSDGKFGMLVLVGLTCVRVVF